MRPGWIFGVAMLACDPPPCPPGVLCLATEEARQTRWGFAPDSLQSADVDGDGQTDLVAASHARGTVSVVWGADGTLGGAATTWSIAASVAGLAVADVDGDGRLDVVTAAPQEDAIVVLRGRAGREFNLETRVAVGDGPRGVIAVDLEGDGRVELVTIDAGDGSIGVVRGEEVTRVVVGPGPRGVAAADVDGDGDLDLAVALADRGAIQVLLGDGEGGLVPGALHPVGAAPYAVVAADLDGDGAVDLASVGALVDAVSVLFGDGSGGVKEQATWATEPDPRGLVVVPGGLAVLSEGTGSVQVIDPVDGATIGGAPAVAATAVTAGDVDGDGTAEAIYAGSGIVGGLVGGVGVRGVDAWAIEPVWADDVQLWLFPVDVDGDGVDEVIGPLTAPVPDPMLGRDVSGPWGLWRDGEMVAELDTGGASYFDRALAADFTGDGRRDVLLAGFDMVLLVGQDDAVGFVPVRVPTMLFGQLGGLFAEDLDGDGQVELVGVTAYGVAEETLEVYSGALDGEDGGSLSRRSRTLVGAVKQARLVDGDGDGWRDLIAVGDEGLVLYEDVTRDEEAPIEPEVLVEVRGARVLEVADFDEDGRLDALVCTGSELVFVADVRAGAAGLVRLGEVGCESLALGDVDGDGGVDALVMRSSGDVAVVTPWVWNEGGWTAWGAASWLSAWEQVFMHVDGDGVPDVLLADDDRPARGVRTEIGPALVDLPLRRFGGAGSQFGDLDGDGVRDMFLYGAGLVVAYGDGEGGFGAQRHAGREEVLAWGNVNSAAVDDFDGDGIEEVFVAVRPVDAWRTELRRLTIVGAEIESETIAAWPVADVRLASGEVDGDGERDLVAFSPRLGLVLLRGTGDGRTFAEGEWVGEALEGLNIGRIADVDGDGIMDFLGSTAARLTVHRGLGGGAMGPAQTWWPVERRFVDGVALADVNHDGRPDVAGSGEGKAVFAFGSGTRVKGAPRVVDEGVDVVHFADLDGDGTVELLTAGRGDHQVEGSMTLSIGRGSGDGAFSFSRTVMTAARPSRLTAADYDGDGVAEVMFSGGNEVTIVRQRR